MAGTTNLVEQIGMWLAKADSTEFPAEREVFLTRAQEVGARHGIDLAVARAAVAKGQKREEPTHKRVHIGEKGQRGLAFYTDLMLRIADNNDLETTINGNGIAVNLFGMPSDIEVAEAIYASAVVAMVKGGDEYLKAGDYKKDVQPRRVKIKKPNPDYGQYYWGSPEPKYLYEWTYVTKAVSGMTARQNFYDGFVREVSRRMRDAKRQVVAAAKAAAAEQEQVPVEQSSTALVLFAKDAEVRGYKDRHYQGQKLGTYNGGSRTPVNHFGAQSAGRSHAQSVNVGGRATGIGGARKQIGG